MKRIDVVGFGPGDDRHMTYQAREAIEKADVIIGYTTYIRMLERYFPTASFMDTPMTKEIERCRMAVSLAEEGKRVALVSSGDAGVYGMAGILLQILEKEGKDIPVEVIPGVTAANAGAAMLGAPLMHDYAVISLSDRMTPLEDIMRRVEYAAMGDFVLALYNPKCRKRTQYLGMAAERIGKYRSGRTPVGIVRHAGRPEAQMCLTTLEKLGDAFVDMFSIVIIGNSRTYVKNGRMITPRGYESKEAF